MGRRGRTKASYVADPERRAQLATLRTIRDQVLREHETELAEAGLLRRVLLRMRIEREIKSRARDLSAQGPRGA